MKRYSKEELIEFLKLLSKEVKKTPTIVDLIRKKDFPSYAAYHTKFGSWNNALKSVGLPINCKHNTYSKKELLNQLIEFKKINLRIPKMKDFYKNQKFPSPLTYHRQFGSWNNALMKVGFEVNVRKDYTKKELVDLIKNKAKELKRNPTSNDLGRKNNMPDMSVFENRFGSWNNALSEAGLKINNYYRKWIKEEVIKWLRYKYDELGQTPGIRDFDKDPKAPAKNTVRKLFENWTNALREAKIPIKRFRSKKELIEIMKKLARELNKTPTRSDMNETKGFPSYTPFVEKFGSYTAACLSAGLIPNDGRNNKIWQNWQKHCEDMAKVIYEGVEIQKEEVVEGVPDIYVPNEKLFIDAKTCGYKDFKGQIKKYCKNNHKLEFWLIFKGIETKRKRVKYVYAEELARKMVKLGREDLAIKCHQFIRNVYSEGQSILT